MRNMTGYSQNLVELMINRLTLQRKSLLPTSFGQILSEPNIGPFPQYNIIMEDTPIEDLISSLERPPRRHVNTAHIRSELERMLVKSKDNYRRLTRALDSPSLRAKKSLMNLFSSFYQQNSQYTEDNVVPFQEITIHPESATPRGGDAPVVFRGRPAFQILDLNKTKDDITLKLMEAEELRMVKRLEKIDTVIRRNKIG